MLLSGARNGILDVIFAAIAKNQKEKDGHGYSETEMVFGFLIVLIFADRWGLWHG